MGKSDPHIFSKYLGILETAERESFGKTCFLGFQGANLLVRSIPHEFSYFYDLMTNGWNINDEIWNIEKESFDTVICTRLAYFSKDPAAFFEKCYNILKPGGILLVDWGVGDHWRFKDYKIGWVKNGEHEHAYEDDNFLWSCVWDDSFLQHPEYKKFSTWVDKHGYKDVKSAIENEVPNVFTVQEACSLFNIKVDMLALWEDLPQLYIILCCTKPEDL